MLEIEDAVRTKLMQPCDLKHFVSNRCYEKYADLGAQQTNVEYLEENIPTYSKRIIGKQDKWGLMKLDQSFELLYKDI